MTKPRVLFNITLHGHQPVGNLPNVLEKCYEECYRPFLELFSRYPRVRFSYHLSGCLLEWLQEHRPEHLELLAEMVGREQVEIVGGAFYEPILTSIPRRDALAQIRLQQEFTRAQLGTEARGVWIPERVWEPSLPSLLKQADVEFSLLDDTHFLAAGLKPQDLHGYFLTEDQGSVLPVFPILERLRYTIPFAEPEETLKVLREIAERAPGTMIAYGDDVEKFGVWPDTFDHCYEKGWLERFLAAIEENLPWIHLVGLAEAVDELDPRGLIYLPETSYAEMNQWALPADVTAAYQQVRHTVEKNPDLAPALPFVRGSTWRNFRVKYPEIRRLYGRALHVSRRMASLPDEPEAQEAKRELYRGQCNCPYWHGIFGGHYLPHLREALWHHLLRAEKLADEITPLGREGDVLVERTDIDLDGRKEYYLRNGDLGFVISAEGGRALELDLRSWGLNLFSVLGRRREAYHEALQEAAAQDGDKAESIHSSHRAKDPGLTEALHYDQYEHLGFSDLFLKKKPKASDFLSGTITDQWGLHGAKWHVEVAEQGGMPLVVVRSPESAAPLQLVKTFQLDGPGLNVRYRVRNASGKAWRGWLAVEIPLALQTGSSPNRVWADTQGTVLGPLGCSVKGQRGGIAVFDWDHDLALSLEADEAEIVTYAVKTVSQSEAGFEGVHQHAVAVFLYPLHLKKDAEREWAMALQAVRAPVRSEVNTGLNV